jgi:hypothetical protein
VKLVAIKIRKHASIWWKHLKNQREHERKSCIVTWVKMKKALKKKYLQEHYRQDVFLKFHNFRQNKLFVYTAKFDHSIMRCDIAEPEEQMVARYHFHSNKEAKTPFFTSIVVHNSLLCSIYFFFFFELLFFFSSWQRGFLI